VYRKIVTAFTAFTASLIVTLPAAAPARAAEVSSPFSCHYTFVAWQGGFSADLWITNSGPEVDGWTARWTFDTPTRATAVWAGWLIQPGPHEAVAGPMSYNRIIRTGSMVGLGWTAMAAATEVPEDITVNGLPC
jgi:hypothetical protein